MPQTVRSADGTVIAFEHHGDGPPLVLVNGAFADRSASAPLAAALATGFAVYAYDRRGRGGSGDDGPYSVGREIDDLRAVIAATGRDAFVFGHSSGAVLALEAAARGLPVAGLAAYEPPYILGDDRPRPFGLGGRLRELVGAGDRAAAVRLFLRDGPGVSEEALAAMETGPMWRGLVALAHTLPYDADVCGDHRIPAAGLARITAPTLVLCGGDSPAWARASVREVAAVVPGARHVSLPGQTHRAATEVLAPVLAGFFAS